VPSTALNVGGTSATRGPVGTPASARKVSVADLQEQRRVSRHPGLRSPPPSRQLGLPCPGETATPRPARRQESSLIRKSEIQSRPKEPGFQDSRNEFRAPSPGRRQPIFRELEGGDVSFQVWYMSLQLTDIWRYPIKVCRGRAPSTRAGRRSPGGSAGDRRWIGSVDTDGGAPVSRPGNTPTDARRAAARRRGTDHDVPCPGCLNPLASRVSLGQEPWCRVRGVCFCGEESDLTAAAPGRGRGATWLTKGHRASGGGTTGVPERSTDGAATNPGVPTAEWADGPFLVSSADGYPLLEDQRGVTLRR